MSLSLVDITSNIASLAVAVGNETLNIEYYPSKVTEKTFAQVASFGQMTDADSVQAGFKTMNELLVDLIHSWDLYEDQEKTNLFPLDVNRLSDIPYMLRINLIKEILGDISPNA